MFEATKPQMARYRSITLEGPLMQNGRRLVLRMDDGGKWRILTLGKQEYFLGCHMRIKGSREGHDIMAADRIIAK